MTQICVVSDIHADVHALMAFLNYVQENCRVEYILNLGDFTQGGANPAEVFDIVMNDQRFINIMGNNEYELVCKFDAQVKKLEEKDEIEETEETVHLKWAAKKLGEERLKKLKELPLSRSLEIYGKSFYLIHADKEYFNTSPLDHGDFLVQVILSKSLKNLSEEEKILSINEHDYILVADTHTQGMEQCYDYLFVKPGAIGVLDHYESKDIENIKFVVIDILPERESVSFKKIKYDISGSVKDCLTNQVPETEFFRYKHKIKSDNEFFDILMYPKYDIEKIPMEWAFWPLLINELLEKCKYIELGCWAGEEDVVQEIESALCIVESKAWNNVQINYKVLNDNKTKDLLINNYLKDNARFKWFNVHLYFEDSKKGFISEHYGNEMHFLQASNDDLNYLKSITNPKRIKLRCK